MTFDDKLAAAEAIWAAGPRKFAVPEASYVAMDQAPTYKNQRLPVSRTLPLAQKQDIVGRENVGGTNVYKLKCGGYADKFGRRIVATKADVKHVERTLGLVRE